MKRNIACTLLTRIASDELIDNEVSKELFKARDIVVCEPNSVLDVLATQETKRIYREQVCEYINRMLDSNILNHELQRQLYELKRDFENGFDGKCEVMYLPTRCKNCPNLRGVK